MPKSTPTCNSILALMYNATTWANVAINASSSPLTNVEVSLHTGALTPATDSQLQYESTVYTNYVRVPVARTSSGWTTPSSGSTDNVAQVQFAQCGASGNTITYVATGTDHSGAGHVWHYGALNSPISVSNGITPQFAARALVITET